MKKLFVTLAIVITSISIYAIITNVQPFKDQIEYLRTATNLLNHNLLYSGDLSYPADFRQFAKRPLGMPTYILLQHQNVNLIRFSQILISLLLFFVCLSYLRNLECKKGSFVIFTLLYIAHFALLVHSSFVFADLLLTSVLTITLYVFLDTKNSLQNKMVWIGFLWAFALAIKPVILPSLLLLPIGVLYVFIKHKVFKWQMLLPVGVFISTASLNYRNTGTFEYSSMTTINLVQYNARLTIAKSYGYDSAMSFSENPAFIVPYSKDSYSTYKSEATGVCKSVIQDNFISYLQIHSIGSVKMLIDPGRFEIYSFFGLPTENESLTEQIIGRRYKDALAHIKQHGWVMVLFLFLLFVSLIKFLGFLFSIKTIKKTWPLFFLILYYMAITGPVGAARLFLPASIAFLTLSVVGLSQLLYFFQKRSES